MMTLFFVITSTGVHLWVKIGQWYEPVCRVSHEELKGMQA
jgi:hypothetical protein